jgi:hypothetical protein
LPLDDREYAEIAAFEPNMSARTENDVNVRLSAEFLAEIARNAEIALKNEIMKSPVDVPAASVTDLLVR